MGDVTGFTAVSLPGGQLGTPLIWHAENIISSNNLLVSASLPAQFFRRYMKGYDRDHRDLL
jgi:hypothetical protein